MSNPNIDKSYAGLRKIYKQLTEAGYYNHGHVINYDEIKSDLNAINLLVHKTYLILKSSKSKDDKIKSLTSLIDPSGKPLVNEAVAQIIIERHSDKLVDFYDNIYVKGNFENYEYFDQFKKELSNFFTPKKELINHKASIVGQLSNNNSISIHIRRNRFSDQIGLSNTSKNQKQSDIFTNQIIDYINKSINFIEKKVQNPQYFIWTNDYKNFEQLSNKLTIRKYHLINENVINDFDLFQYAKHFIVGPSSFHWWGAWLNKNSNKICIRPSNLNPSNNENFWPKDWISI